MRASPYPLCGCSAYNTEAATGYNITASFFTVIRLSGVNAAFTFDAAPKVEGVLSHALAWCTSPLEASCLDSHASTITRLRNGQLEDEKKVMLPCRSLVNSSSRNIIRYTTVAMACAEGQAIVHHGMPVRGIASTSLPKARMDTERGSIFRKEV